MKKSTILLILLFAGAFQSIAQQVTPQQQAVLNDFGVSVNDHRGVEFTTDSTNIHATYNDVKTAIEAFFASPVKRDFTRIRINNSVTQVYYNGPLDVIDLANIYLQVTNNQTTPNE